MGIQIIIRYEWTSSSSTITYEKLLLDTGIGLMDAASGVWTAQETGLYQISWSLRNWLQGDDDNVIFLYRNGEGIDESLHRSFIGNPASSSQTISEQGGRTMLLRLDAADTLSLRTYNLFEGTAHDIQFCVNLLA